MKALIYLLALLGGPSMAADMFPPQTIVIQGGVDSSKCPLTGCDMSGNLTMVNANSVLFSSAAASSADAGVRHSTETFGGLDISASDGDLGATVFNFRSRNGSIVAITLSTTTAITPDTPSFTYDSVSRELDMFSGPTGGFVTGQPGRLFLSVDGATANFTVNTSSAVITGTDVFVEAGGGTFRSNAATNDFSNGNVKLGGTTGKALCVNASGLLSVCTSVVGATGLCTCP